jgi:hypothetical protein
MPEENLDTVRQLARDLRTEEPRPPKEKLAGFDYGARALDKCRASLVGWQGEFNFNCPMDQRFFSATGIEAEQFKAKTSTGATDEEMERWVQENASGEK